jgi:hypothetical protein
MPCDTVQLNQVNVGKMHPALLVKALEGLGATNITARSFYLQGVYCRLEGEKLIVPEGSEHLADKLKVAYSRQVVAYSAKKQGFKVKEVRPNVFALVK